MADIVISDLPTITSATVDDVFIINDGNTTTSTITWGNLQQSLQNLSGQVLFDSGTVSLPSIGHSGDNNCGLFFPTNDNIAISTNGTQRAVVTSNGNIGIGNTNPDAFSENAKNLVIGNTSSQSNGLTIVAPGTHDSCIFFADQTTAEASGVGRITYQHTTDNLVFTVDGVENSRMTGDGRLGIGSTSPQELLHVKSGVSGVSGAIANSSGIIIEAGVNDNAGLQFQSYPDTDATIYFGDPDSSNVGHIKYAHQNDTLRFSVNGKERIFIDNKGALGIGSVSVGSTLNVSRSTGTATSHDSVLVNAEVQPTLTGIYSAFTSETNTNASTFTLSNYRHFSAKQDVVGSGSVITHQVGYYADSTLFGGVNNYGFFSAVPGGTNNWGFYSSGSAKCYFGGVIQAPGTYNNSTASAPNMYVFFDGTVFRSVSSRKYKRNIETMEDHYADNFIDNARPVWYRSKCNADKLQHSHWGIIAEEMEEVDPRFVHHDGKGNPEGVQYDRMVVPLINLVQRQKKQIEDLTARIEKLEQG